MRAIKVDLPRNLEFVEVHAISDVHLGSSHCDFKAIYNRVQEIAGNPNAYVVLNGDLINNSTKTSLGDVYSETITPMEQLKQAVALFKPIKDKILAITSGNHEGRTYKADGIDLMELMAIELGIGNRYAKESATVFLRVGEMPPYKKATGKTDVARQICYVIFATHGAGGGRVEGSKINRLVHLANIVDADIYIHSHTHLPAALKQSFYRTDTRNSTIAEVDKLFVNTNAWLRYGGYGEALGYKPASISPPVIYLSGKRKEFRVNL